ncbi:methyltransferase small domain protein, putative [Actinidia rufa]|uniref:Methyltransferase small domain protein, putative n=1 Tax=Actinidia rufa TaxID=165716 RepID=A0A7J0F4X2_9ERIC|nr:methyltransferase small domain protein, putative [Actinidia rufa]
MVTRLRLVHPPGHQLCYESDSLEPSTRPYSDWDSSSWTRDVSQLDRDPELSWSRGSDSFTHPVTNSVTNRIVWNPPPGSYSDWDSSSRTREVSQLDRDPELSWSRGSDSFTHPVTNSVTNRIVWKPPPGSNPDWDSSSWTREVSQLDRDPELRRSRGSDSFTHPVTKSVTNRIDWNPPPSLNPNWDSSSWTQEVSELDRDPETDTVTRLKLVHPPGLEPSTRLRSGLGFILMDPRSESTRPRSPTDTAVRRDGLGGEMDEALQQFPKDTAGG